MRKAITEAFSDFWDVFNDETTDNSSNNTIKDKEKEEKEPEIDTSITISKWTTETVSSKYNSDDIEAEITFNDVSFVDEIRPPEPQQDFYSYYPAKEGKTYAVVNLKLKNLWSTSFTIRYVLNNLYGRDNFCTPKAIFWWKYEYTADVVSELEKDSKWKYSFEDYSSIDPLETMDIIVAYSVPNEVKDKDAKLNICLWDQKINLDFTTKEPIEENVAEEPAEE